MKPKPLTDEQVEDIQKKLIDRFEAARGLPVKDVARLFGVSQPTVRRLIDSGELAHSRVANRVVVMQADAIQYLIDNRHGGQSQAS